MEDKFCPAAKNLEKLGKFLTGDPVLWADI
jgi:hypothetical protein